MGKWFPLLGLGFAAAGADKLLGTRAYDQLFAKWGWSECARAHSAPASSSAA